MVRRQECKISGAYGPQSREMTHKSLVGKSEKEGTNEISNVWTGMSNNTD